MIGLFLALLELVREKLIQARQNPSSPAIHLRALTDEPAEQAVQKAILTTESESIAAQAEQQKKPPVPISELPPKKEPAVALDKQQEQISIPINEIPPENKSALTPQKQK
jgi:hypothetical protein